MTEGIPTGGINRIADIRVTQYWMTEFDENGEKVFRPANYIVEVMREGSLEWERVAINNVVVDPPAEEVNNND